MPAVSFVQEEEEEEEEEEEVGGADFFAVQEVSRRV
jgi:hypothetical protein